MRLCSCFICLWLLLPVLSSLGTTVVVAYASEEENELSVSEELLGELDLEEIQSLVDEMLGDDSFSLWNSLRAMMSGQQPFSAESVVQLVIRAVNTGWKEQKKVCLELILLVLAAALFTNFSRAFETGQVGEISFYVVYLVTFILLVNTFSEMSENLSQKLNVIVQFMKVAAPAYNLAVMASTGASTAAVFYQIILLLILAIELLAVNFVLPCINLYVLLRMVNYLSRENMLSRLADLLKVLAEWSLRTMLGVLVGLQVVQSLISPVADRLSRGLLGKAAAAIPGLGGAVNSVTELVLTSAILVRNSLGVALLAVLVFWGLAPVVKYAVCGFLYKLLGALAQPISDRRMSGCIETLGEGCVLLMKTLLTVEILCMLSFVVIAST